jgi:DNA-directed RNA polymerase alpha subunit
MSQLIDNLKLGRPANRALKDQGIETVNQLTAYTEKDLLALHAFGPKALGIIKRVLEEENLLLKEEEN